MADFAVVGMGRFGRAVARSLAEEGQSVLAVDRDPERLRAVAEDVDAVAAVDMTDEEAVAALRLERMSCVVVAIGSRATEASLLTTAILRRFAVSRIVARAFDERHARVLLAIGADEVLNPEDEIGQRLALRLAHPDLLDQIRLGDALIAEVEAPEAWVGESLGDLYEAHRIATLALRRGGATDSDPRPEERVASGDVLVLMGRGDTIRRVAALK